MKIEISYKVWKTEVIEVPKEWEFYFNKGEHEYTEKEWNRFERKPFLNRFNDWDEFEIVREVK